MRRTPAQCSRTVGTSLGCQILEEGGAQRVLTSYNGACLPAKFAQITHALKPAATMRGKCISDVRTRSGGASFIVSGGD